MLKVRSTVLALAAVDQQAYGCHYGIKAQTKGYSTATVQPCISESPLKSMLEAYVNIDHYGKYGMSEQQLNFNSYFSWCHHR